jgi:hypothetical protein
MGRHLPHVAQFGSTGTPVDPDPAELARTIRSLFVDRRSVQTDGWREIPVALLHKETTALLVRSDAVLDADIVRPDELELVLADAYAHRLVLEVERLRTKRRMIAALIDALIDPAARADADELARRYEVVADDQRSVGELVEKLTARESRGRRFA